jgi:two-component system, NarL family, nitrate/nitrite sensor histidine kinase NarX
MTQPIVNSTDSEDSAADRGSYKIPALRALSEIAASLSSDSNIDHLLERFLTTMIKLAGADAGAVRVLSADGEHLRLVGAVGLPPEVVEREQETNLECGVCGKAARDHSVQRSSNSQECNRNSALSYFGECCKNVVAVPLQHKGKVMGVYNLFMASDKEVPEDVSLLFYSISEHLGMALENARLTRENMRITLMNERQMLANEIHDSLAQTLAYMKMRIALLQEAMHSKDEPLAGKYLNDVDDAMESAYSGLRELLTQFRQRMDPRGLMPALQDLLHNFSTRTGVAVDFANQVQHIDLTPDQEVQVFHIVQEALNNIGKHSRAQHVRLKIEAQEGSHLVTVSDDGVGLACSESSGNGMHLGMNIMRERAQRLGGEIAVESQAGAGTKVQLTFPATPTRKVGTL